MASYLVTTHFAFFIFESDREEFFVGSGLPGGVAAFAAVVQDAERRGIFPIHYFPGQQRVLRFGLADEGGILLAIIFFPVGQLLVAVSVAWRRYIWPPGVRLCDHARGSARWNWEFLKRVTVRSVTAPGPDRSATSGSQRRSAARARRRPRQSRFVRGKIP